MVDDPEVTAMQQLTESFTPLDEEARQRVIEWAIRRFGTPTAAAPATHHRAPDHAPDRRPAAATGHTSTSTYADFADLYDAAKPKTDHKKASWEAIGSRSAEAPLPFRRLMLTLS